MTGIVRISVSYKNPLVLALDDDALWLNVHLGVAVISACLPTYKPLVTIATNKAKSYYSYINGSNFTSAFGSSKKHRVSPSAGQRGSTLTGSKGSSKAWSYTLGHNDGDDVELVERQGSTAGVNKSTIV